MSRTFAFDQRLEKYADTFHPVIPFIPGKDKILHLDLSRNNTELTVEIFNDTSAFSAFIGNKLESAGAVYGIGGYNEYRSVYKRSQLFGKDSGEEPRRLHLGMDIWGKPGTPVFAPFGGVVHSYAYHAAMGDYGATIVLQHQLDSISFYTLYGHLSLIDLGGLREGQFITIGEEIAHLGKPEENGQWPPHLHFQIILDMHNFKGDYPGVCKFSEKEIYLQNCPDPDYMLQMMQFASEK